MMKNPVLFHTTQWSMILSAAEDSEAALENLCRTYWRPLYGYARRSGQTEHDAEDMVQGFLARVLEKQWIKSVKRESGPFRRFLQMAFKHYLLDQYDHTQAKKRGGGTQAVALDAASAEDFFAAELATTDTPETAYERAWALEVFARARKSVRDECIAAGRVEAHDALESDEPHIVLAARLGITVSAFTSFSFRVRRRLQELIRDEILQTVSNPADLEAEIAALLHALSERQA